MITLCWVHITVTLVYTDRYTKVSMILILMSLGSSFYILLTNREYFIEVYVTHTTVYHQYAMMSSLNNTIL